MRLTNFSAQTESVALTVDEDVMPFLTVWTNLMSKIVSMVIFYRCLGKTKYFLTWFTLIAKCGFWQIKCRSDGICVDNRRRCDGEVSERLRDTQNEMFRSLKFFDFSSLIVKTDQMKKSVMSFLHRSSFLRYVKKIALVTTFQFVAVMEWLIRMNALWRLFLAKTKLTWSSFPKANALPLYKE